MHLSYQTCHAKLQLGPQQHMLLLQLTELNLERNKMNTEKVNLENQLEAEQEYILNKLHKQVHSSCTEVCCCNMSKVISSCNHGPDAPLAQHHSAQLTQQKEDALGP